jgi:DNA modification methylase
MVRRPLTRAVAVNRQDELPWQIAMLPVASLRPSDRNARTHSKKQIAQIADSIRKFGVINPIVVDANNQIVAGHARKEAAGLLGIKKVPVIRASHLSDVEIRAYMLADNKLAEKAGWDREILAVELAELQIKLPELEMDLGITGFEAHEVDAIMVDFDGEQSSPADDVPELQPQAVSRTGDLFLLGQHRLVVGDARIAESYERLLDGDLAQMAFLDPPYNVRIAGHAGGRGKVKHREFAVASGEMTSTQFTGFLRETLALCARNLADGAISYVCMDWRHAGELLEAGAKVFDELKNICVWNKTTPGQGSFYRSQHELVFVYKRGTAPHINTFELGQHGRTRSNVWTYPGANTFRAGRMDDLRMHPTVKPVALVADAMRDCSKRGGLVLDVFVGAGTTLAAAETVGRRAACIEIDPVYADVAIRRWERLTGKDAVLAASSKTFDELSNARKRST